MEDPSAGLLDGITIADLGDEATAFAARLLAELGARVIRIEPLEGDALRRRGPFLHGREGVERSLAHLLYNSGKQSAAFDLEQPDGRRAAERIAGAADAVIAPLAQPAWLREMLGRLGQAPGGPGIVDIVFRRGAPGEVATDLVATAAGGLLTLNGFAEDPPNWPAGQLGYKEASLAAAQAALALVITRLATHRGGTITVSLQEAVNFTTIQTANANWLHWQGRVPSRHTPLSPFTIHRAGDGRWVSFTVHPPNWPRYADWAARDLDASELLAPEWNDAVYRAQNIRQLADYTRRLCALYPRDELIRQGQGRGLLVLPVNSISDIAADRHLLARGFFADVEHPALGERLRMPRTAFLAEGDRPVARPAPSLGEHTWLALREVAGYSEDEAAALFASGTALGPRPRVAAPTTARPTARWSRPAAPRKPLAGVRIVDFCWAIAGPLGTRILADMGADVIKVESEYRLDPIRQIGVQPPGLSSWNTNGQFNDCNTSKRSLVLNLNTSEGIDVARRLIATADVVTSNYTPDRLDRWGLGYDALRELRPGIIVANMAVMGIRGPHKDWRSYGSGIVAMCGLGDLTGFPGRDPIGLGTLHTDFTVPYFAATQIMAALIHRERTGEGRYLELAQYEASIHLLDTELVEFLNNGATPGRNGNRCRWMAPHGVFPAAGDDRWVAIACRDDGDWAALCGVMGLDALRECDRFARLDEVEAAITAWTRTRDRWEAAAALQAAGVPASAVEDLDDLLHHDAAMAADYRETPLPAGVTAIVQEQPILWDGERVPFTRAPLWGEHTDEVLREIGLGDGEIAALAERGVLF